MDGATVLTAISLFGSLQALLIGLAIFVRMGASTERVASPDRPRRVVLGVLMIVFGAAVAVIALDHAAWFSEAVPFAWIEHTLALFFPLFFRLVNRRSFVVRSHLGRTVGAMDARMRRGYVQMEPSGQVGGVLQTNGESASVPAASLLPTDLVFG